VKTPFVLDMAKVTKNTSMLYLAVLFVLIINCASFFIPTEVNRIIVPILAIVVGYICGRSQYDITGNFGVSVFMGIFAAFVLIDIFVVLYMLVRNKKVISEHEKNTTSL